MDPRPRIHITGASGCGVSTLGEALAERLRCAPLGTGGLFWAPPAPPFPGARAIPDRPRLLGAAFEAAPDGWVLSGSLDGWGDPLIASFERVIFRSAPIE